MKSKSIAYVGVATAMIAVMAQISIPMPSGVPMTMQSFAIILAAVVLGAKKSFCSLCVYVLLGVVGLPVFASFTGGIGKIVGPTGGFIISFPVMAYIIGLGTDCRKRIKGIRIIMLVLGICVNYAAGVAVFCAYSKCRFIAAVYACVLPCILSSIIQAVLAFLVGKKVETVLMS